MPINYFETSFEARERRAQIENLYHGEAVDLVAVVTTDGVPKSLDGYTATGVFQPTSMHGSDDFYELSADIVDNHIIVHWTPGSDFGEDSYMVWVLVSKEGDAAYPITWRLDMAYSPNFPLSALDPIPKTIDFSKYELLNAPWLELSAADDLPYLPLSGGTVTGEFAVENFIQSDETNITLGKNNDLTQTANTVVVGNGNSVTGAGIARSSAIVVGMDNLARGLERRQVLVGASLSADTSGPAIGVGFYGSIGADSVAVAEGPNFTKMQVGRNAVAIGFGISSVADGSIAIGQGANTGNVRTVQLGEGKPTAAYQFNVFDKNVLSGYDFILNRDRIPYLSEYETKADATAEHQAIVDGLSVYAKKEDIPEVPTDLSAFTNSPGYLTAHQSLSDYAKKEEVQAVDDKLSNYLPLSGGTLTGPVTVSHILTTANLEAPGIEALEDIVNIKADHLSAKNDLIVKKSIVFGDDSTISSANDLATKEEVQAVDDKLSDYATETYVQEYVAEHGGGSVDISACLSSAEFDEIEELQNDGSASLSSIIEKIDEVIRALKRANGPQPPDPTKTRVVYTDDTTAELDLVGNVTDSSIPNINSVKAISFGTNVTSFADQLLYYKANIERIEVPSSVTSIPFKFAGAPTGDNGKLSSLVLPDTITTIGQEAFRGCALTSITLPTALTSINNYAFTKSRYIEEIHIGPNLQSLGTETFCYNMSLREITVDPNNQYFSSENGILFNKNKTIVEQVPITAYPTVTIPEGVTRIKQGACNNLSATTVVLPSTLTTIDIAAFVGSSAWTTLTIPSSVTSIGQYQFNEAGAKTITMEGKTMAQVQAMRYYPWNAASGTQFVCTDGTITR